MTKRLFFILGMIAGFLFAEVLRRKKMERLKTLETRTAQRKKINEFAAREWQKEVAAMPFAERMDYELWDARQRLDNGYPLWNAEDDDEPLP